MLARSSIVGHTVLFLSASVTVLPASDYVAYKQTEAVVRWVVAEVAVCWVQAMRVGVPIVLEDIHEATLLKSFDYRV